MNAHPLWLAIRHLVILVSLVLPSTGNADFPDTIEKVKPSVVAIGTYRKTQSPQFAFRGTGFVIGDGNMAATNAHVLPENTAADGPELVVLIRTSHGEHTVRRARVTARANERDLAILRFDGPPLPALKLLDSAAVREGDSIAFTGFPIGGVLGFSPVTHRGIVSAITPIAIPGGNARQLNESAIQRLKNGTFNIFQLDATAYPGNSGSPVYQADTGEVIGVINMVFVKGRKESALSQPSGISYAIPVNHLKSLLFPSVN